MAIGTPEVFIVGQEFNPYKQFKVVCIPEPVFLHRGLSPNAKLMYGRLARYAGEDGNAYPAVGTLAEELDVSVSQVHRYLRELIAKRFIRVEPCAGKTNRYKFLWHEAFDNIPLSSMTGVSPMTPLPLSSMTPLPLSSMTPKESHSKRVTEESQSCAREEAPPVAVPTPLERGTPAPDPPPDWELDRSYVPIVEAAREFWPDSMAEDFAEAHRVWRRMSTLTRLDATAKLRAKQAAMPAEGRFVCKTFARYMGSPEWKRPARPALIPRYGPGSVDPAVAILEQRLAEKAHRRKIL